MRCIRCLSLLVLLAGSLTGAAAQSESPAGFPKPDRPVAPIVSPIWHSEDERDAAKEVPQTIRLLGIAPGMTVADVGAGSGYYVTRLSPLLGSKGHLLAEDMTPVYLAALRAKVAAQHLANVDVIAGKPDDAALPPGSTDRVILVHMYHEIQQPFALLYRLAVALKPGAKIGIVDATRPIMQHGTPPDLLKCEVESLGFVETGFHPLEGSEAYLAVFELPEGTKPKLPERVCPAK
jgi:predicted methyltransferase